MTPCTRNTESSPPVRLPSAVITIWMLLPLLLTACGGGGAGADPSASAQPAPSQTPASSPPAPAAPSPAPTSPAPAPSPTAPAPAPTPTAPSPAPTPPAPTPAACDLPSTFSWTSTQPLIAPQSADFVSIKDPTIVRYNNLYHVFATVFDTARNAWSAVYLNFSDFSKAASAVQVPLAGKPAGDAVAPQVFYFRPHNRWYLISQWGAKYSTNTDIANPDGWTAPKPLLSGGPANGLDYWVICDSANCHLFFSGDDGKLYHSKTAIGSFPNFSGYETVMSDQVGNLFEASNVYKVAGTDKYLLLVEAYGPRYFRSWTSTSLDGPWTPLADKQSAPFAGAANVSFDGAPWTNDISHGEMIRAGYDETLTIDACNMQYLYQGVDPKSTATYDHLPYRLGLLKAR